VRRSVDVRRTPIKLAAAALAAGLAAAACGPVKMGAAAILGDQRISSSSLSAEVANLDDGYRAYRHQVQLQYPVSQMPQQVLGWLVRFQVRDRVAEREGIRVTPADVQKGLADITARIRQSGNTAPLAEVAVSAGLPPDMITDLGRYQAIETKLVRRLDGGTLPTSPGPLQSLQNAFNAVQCRAAKSLDIQINPQFGALDYNTFAVVPAATTLSRAEPLAAPSPTASAPKLTPPC
jgi:hypothetical protein